MLRATGRVVRVDSKSGTKVNEQTGEARNWGFDVIRLLVADLDVVEVQRFKDNPTPCPSVGDQVDYAVSTDSYKGKVSVQLDKPWADLFPKSASAPSVVRSA